ncbi:MAG: 3-hydroxyacyl-ACP dehydratase FabZ [Thermodesulfobacteriota bacterium]|jgi:3-hydroxyacyl-[acyl-carrier-protein] dehydratase
MSVDPKRIDIKEILSLLPHRYPFIMVDRIVDVEPGVAIRGIKNVSMNENFFQGHFPGEPVMPGVLMLEGMAQVGALLAYLTDRDMVGTKLVYFAGLDKVKFRQKVVPGDQLLYELTVLKRKSKFWVMAGKALVDGKLVAEAELMATFA